MGEFQRVVLRAYHSRTRRIEEVGGPTPGLLLATFSAAASQRPIVMAPVNMRVALSRRTGSSSLFLLAEAERLRAGPNTIALAADRFGVPRHQRAEAAVDLCRPLGTNIPGLP